MPPAPSTALTNSRSTRADNDTIWVVPHAGDPFKTNSPFTIIPTANDASRDLLAQPDGSAARTCLLALSKSGDQLSKKLMTNFTAELEDRMTAAQLEKSVKDWRMLVSHVISVYSERGDPKGPKIHVVNREQHRALGKQGCHFVQYDEYEDEPPESDQSLPEHDPELKASIQTLIDRSVKPKQVTSVDARTTQLQSAAMSSGAHRSSRP